MRNNVFLVLTILLIGGLFCLGIINVGDKTPIPDHRGTMSPTSSVKFSRRQPAAPSSPSVIGKLSPVTRHRSSVNGHRTQVANSPSPVISISGTLHTSSSAQLHSIGGGINGSSSGIANNAKSPAATRNSGYAGISNGIGSLSLPAYNQSLLLAYNNEPAGNTTASGTRAGMRATPHIGYTTNDSGNTRRRVYRPGISEEDDGWYYDTDENEWKEIPTGGEKMIDGILCVWNGTEWVPKEGVQDPSEVDYPVGNGVWILILLAKAYTTLKRNKHCNNVGKILLRCYTE